jgi:hypothetical protein
MEQLDKLRLKMAAEEEATSALENLPKETPKAKPKTAPKPPLAEPTIPAGGIYDKNETRPVKESEVDAVKRMQKRKR